jgi:hypothetical protein
MSVVKNIEQLWLQFLLLALFSCAIMILYKNLAETTSAAKNGNYVIRHLASSTLV